MATLTGSGNPGRLVADPDHAGAPDAVRRW